MFLTAPLKFCVVVYTFLILGYQKHFNCCGNTGLYLSKTFLFTSHLPSIHKDNYAATEEMQIFYTLLSEYTCP